MNEANAAVPNARHAIPVPGKRENTLDRVCLVTIGELKTVRAMFGQFIYLKEFVNKEGPIVNDQHTPVNTDLPGNFLIDSRGDGVYPGVHPPTQLATPDKILRQ